MDASFWQLTQGIGKNQKELILIRPIGKKTKNKKTKIKKRNDIDIHEDPEFCNDKTIFGEICNRMFHTTLVAELELLAEPHVWQTQCVVAGQRCLLFQRSVHFVEKHLKPITR